MARLERAGLLARVKHCDGHLRTMAKEHWIAFENIGLPTCCHIHGSHPGIELSIRPTGPNVIALRLRSLTVRTVLHTVIPIITLETTLRCCILYKLHCPVVLYFETLWSFVVLSKHCCVEYSSQLMGVEGDLCGSLDGILSLDCQSWTKGQTRVMWMKEDNYY